MGVGRGAKRRKGVSALDRCFVAQRVDLCEDKVKRLCAGFLVDKESVGGR